MAALRLCLLLIVTILAPRVLAVTLRQVVTSANQQRLARLLQADDSWTSLRNAYLAVKGLEGLGVQVSKEIAGKACATIETPSDLESIFYASSLSVLLGKNCKVTIAGVEETLRGHLQKDTSISTLYYVTLSMKNFAITFDGEKVYSLVQAALDEDDSPASTVMAFEVVATLVSDNVDVMVVAEMVEDIVNQADEADDTMNFDAGLQLTSSMVVSAFNLAKAVNSTPDFTEDQLIKFSNYFTVNSFTNSLEHASYMLQAAGVLSRNKFFRPTALLLADHHPVTATNPTIQVRFSDILDQTLGKASVRATSIDNADGDTILTKKQFTAESDGVTYTLPLFGDVPQAGTYDVQMSAIVQSDSVAFDIPDATLKVTVSQSVSIRNTKLAVLDREQGVSSVELSLEHPNKIKDTLTADHHQKVKMSFNVIGSKLNEPVKVHQAFVMLKMKGQEVFFVATADDDKLYTFELDLQTAGKESFGHLSGAYDMSLVIGDFAIEKPFVWNIGSITLKFSGTPVEPKTRDFQLPRPEIKHMFREPDKRAPPIVASTFTIIVMAPLGLLVILWLIMGANFSNVLDSGVWGILFHCGLVAIFELFFLFWLKLNMFQTLWYLAIIGVVTFFSGNKMLKVKAAKNKT